jgi:hypothetical protein
VSRLSASLHLTAHLAGTHLNFSAAEHAGGHGLESNSHNDKDGNNSKAEHRQATNICDDFVLQRVKQKLTFLHDMDHLLN